MFAGGLSITEAIATSLIPVSAFGFTTASMHAMENNVNWLISAFFVIGGAADDFAGTRLIHRFPKKALRQIFSVILVAVAFYIVASSVLGG